MKTKCIFSLKSDLIPTAIENENTCISKRKKRDGTGEIYGSQIEKSHLSEQSRLKFSRAGAKILHTSNVSQIKPARAASTITHRRIACNMGDEGRHPRVFVSSPMKRDFEGCASNTSRRPGTRSPLFPAPPRSPKHPVTPFARRGQATVSIWRSNFGRELGGNARTHACSRLHGVHLMLVRTIVMRPISYSSAITVAQIQWCFRSIKKKMVLQLWQQCSECEKLTEVDK